SESKVPALTFPCPSPPLTLALADPLCPAKYKLDCLLRRRLGCGPEGAPTCGPCFPNYEEDSGGDCVPKKVQKHEGKTKTQKKRPQNLPGLIRSLLAKHEKNLRPPSMGTPLPALVVMCTVTGLSGLVVAAICWYRLQREVHLAQKMAYTNTRGNQYRYHQPSAYMDSRLAQSCQVHHYQHQKKLLTNEDRESPKPIEQLSTESETENGDYTVYECPGLAPSGEMEVHNPLFDTSTLRRCPP
ncbi:hypothetical protein lerEdw1_010299, partial [Lerista edwardsae]